MDSQDDAFRLTRDDLKAKQRCLKNKEGEIAQTKLMPSLMKKLTFCMKKPLFGNETPESFLNTLWLNNSIHFGL